NHGLGDKPMFSLETGKMEEGIGHYRYQAVPGKKQVLCISDTPYPCDFDEGLVLAMAQRFEPTATLVHQNPTTCRKKGGMSCTYTVNWK
ncbi:MAG TPA: hypothetical protein VGB96_04255, partial [Archangium sp.]